MQMEGCECKIHCSVSSPDDGRVHEQASLLAASPREAALINGTNYKTHKQTMASSYTFIIEARKI